MLAPKLLFFSLKSQWKSCRTGLFIFLFAVSTQYVLPDIGFSQWDGSVKFCLGATLKHTPVAWWITEEYTRQAGRNLSLLWLFSSSSSPWSSLKHQGEVTRRRLFQQRASPGLSSTSALKGSSVAAKIGLFYYYCFNMAFYGGQMSWLAAFFSWFFFTTIIIFWCEIHFTPYEPTSSRCNALCSEYVSEEQAGPPPSRPPRSEVDQEGPLVPKMWSNSLRMSSTAWFW